MKFLRFVISRSGAARRRLIAAVAAGAVSGLLSVGLLALVNRALEQGGDPTSRTAWLFAALIVVVPVIRLLSTYLLAHLGQGMVRDLRVEMSRRVLATPLPRLEALGAPKLLATLTDDINAMTQAMLFVPVIVVNGTVVLGCLAYMAWIDWRLFGLLLVAFTVGIVTYQIPAGVGRRRFVRSRQQEDLLFGHFRALIDGVKELMLHRRRRGAFTEELTGTADRMRELRVGAALVYGAAASWGHLLFFLVLGVLLFLRPAGIEAGRDVLVGYTVVLLYMMTPLQTFLDSVPLLSRADVAVEKVRTLGLSLARVEEIGTTEAVAAADTDFTGLELQGVTHTYRREGQEHPFTLGPVDVALRPGTLTFLVGGNGSGKTTLAKILMGLYAPEQGRLVLNGRPVEAEGLDAYRQSFSAVFADFHLFESLLGLGRPDLDEQSRRYLAELELDHKVEIREGVFSTTELSQGQRKRLALLTAYLEDRPVYVFDEWAADQDPVFKEIFYHHILPDLTRRGKAVLAISHDDRYFHLADEIWKLEDGALRAEGSPEELQRRGVVAEVPREPVPAPGN